MKLLDLPVPSPSDSVSNAATLQCDYEPRIHEHVAIAHERTLEWVVRMGLAPAEGPETATLNAAKFAWLAARAYPQVTVEQLELVSDWITFLFFYDDRCDTTQTENPAYAAALTVTEDRLIAIGHGRMTSAPLEPLERALADIRRRAATFAKWTWLERFGQHFEEYVIGCRWERDLRIRGEAPSLATYDRLRPLISAVPPCFDIAAMCIEGLDLAFVEHPLVQQLHIMATNHICWVNDIYGLEKELYDQTTSNLVMIVARENGSHWGEAMQRSIVRCNEELTAFDRLFAIVEADANEAERAYLDALVSWLRGGLDWYSDTKRYLLPHAAGNQGITRAPAA
ncbi:MAG: hypothetical protein AAF799_02145 [Myxococcota bacterium]